MVPGESTEVLAVGGSTDFWAVIPAGGSGTRLWPLSRRHTPKFLLDLTGSGSSMLADAVTRLCPLVHDRCLVVTGQAHVAAVRAALPSLSHTQILVEPTPAGSLPAIGLAAARLEIEHPGAVLGSFAADHVIGQQQRFTEQLVQAEQMARTGALVTLGIQPTRPATGFGYIRAGELYSRESPARRVMEFVEKPDAEAAQGYIREGYLWNAGIFVVQVTSLMQMIEEWHPEVAVTLRRIAADPDTIEDLWPTLTPTDIDWVIAEPAARAGQVAVIPADFDWDDIGDMSALERHLPPSPQHENMRVGGVVDRVLTLDSSGLVIANGDRTVVTLGVDDIVVIDTPDAVLITTRRRAQDVKGVVGILAQQGRQDLL